MPLRYPNRRKRLQAIVHLLRQHPDHWYCQAEISQQLKYPANMVMKDLIRLEDMKVLLCDNGRGKYQLMENAW